MRQEQRPGPRSGQRNSPEAGRRNDRHDGQTLIQFKHPNLVGPVDRLSGLSTEERQLYDALMSGEAWLRQRPLDGHWLVGRKIPGERADEGTSSFDYVAEDVVWALMDRHLVDRHGRPMPDRQRFAPPAGREPRHEARPRQEIHDGLAVE